MSALTDDKRQTFAAIADILIPNAEGMPAASEVDVHGPMLDRILGLRPDMTEAFHRGLDKAAGQDPQEAAEALNQEDPEALTAIGLAASAGYYMTQRVRELIGYPGQEMRPHESPDEIPPYVANGLLQPVIDRGPIYVPTPRREG